MERHNQVDSGQKRGPGSSKVRLYELARLDIVTAGASSR